MTLNELKALAEKATPGPWRYSPWHVEEGPACVRKDDYGILCGNFASDDTAIFVAACSPDYILKLIACVEAASGLSRGFDWNNGTHAKAYRKKLIDALAALDAKEGGGG